MKKTLESAGAVNVQKGIVRAIGVVAIGLAITLNARATSAGSYCQDIGNAVLKITDQDVPMTTARRKISSELLVSHGLARPGSPKTFQLSTVNSAADNSSAAELVDVVVECVKVSDSLLASVTNLGGKVVEKSVRFKVMRIKLPADKLEALAEHEDVKIMQQWIPPIHNGVNKTEGIRAHMVDKIHQLGYTGKGVKIGVISDSVRHLSDIQKSGDLPKVTVLDGASGIQDDGSDEGEGTAMLEIVHDMAPDAELYFATRGGDKAIMADNIYRLQEAGCEIIVDDITFPDEFAFGYDVLSKAVEEVSAQGVLFLSSAGNSGYFTSNTRCSTWEGDFYGKGDDVHYFKTGDTAFNNTVIQFPGNAFPRAIYITLQWADDWEHPDSDYDLWLYAYDRAGKLVQILKGENRQGGGNGFHPYEIVILNASNVVQHYLNGGCLRAVIRKISGDDRFLRLDGHRSSFSISTSGNIYGHNGTDSAVSVAMCAVPQSGTFSTSSHVNGNTSDGPRKIFFDIDGSQITPGNLSSSGGKVVTKPDCTGADCVSCATPGFETFSGTSAAAPHIAAIAALVLEKNPSLTPAQVKEILFKSTWDIDDKGWDIRSGYGIVNAELAIENTPGQVAAPTNVKASDGKYDDGVRIEWTGSEGTTSYNLYRSENGTRKETPYKTNVTSPYPDTDTDPGVDYYYWVEAVKGSDKAVSASDAGWRKPTITRSWMAETQRFSWKGGSTNVAITANTAWTASCKKDWVTITSQGGSTLAYSVEQNTEGVERNDTITMTAAGNTPHAVTTTIAVKQLPRGRPENDDFEHAGVLTGVSGVTSGDTTMATRQNGEPDIRPDDGPTSIWPLSHDPTTNTIWWVWTAPKDGITTFDLSDSDIAVAFEVYASAELPGSEDSPLVTVCDGETMSATVPVTEGVTYSIRVGGYENAEGAVVLKWSLAESGNVWYVNAATGNNANSGKSENSAKKTIQAAIDAAVGYDTILVAPGTYSRISVSNTKPGIVIKSTGGFAVTTIDGQSSGTCASFGDRTIRLEGFTICNGAGALSGAGGVDGGTVVDSVIRDNSAGFSYTAGGAANSTLINCQLSSNVGVQAGGAYECTLSNCTVVGNVCTGNSNSSGGVFGCSAFNSIVWGNTDGYGATSNYVSYHDSFSHCCSYPAGNFVGCVPSVTDDPQLIVSNGIYVLAATSPCIDAGDTLVVSTPLDLMGNARVVGAAVDMGAVEYQTARLKSPSPTEFMAVATSTSCVTLSWEYEHANATFYLYRSVPFLGGESLIATVTGDTSYEDHDVEKGYEYTYWIVAQRTDGDYAESDRVASAKVAVPYFDPTPIDTYTVIYCPGEYGVEPKKTFNEINSFHRVQGVLFTRPNYTQTAWTTEDGETTYNFGDLIVLSPGVTKLYPVWTENDGNQPVAVFDGTAKTLTFYCDGLDHAGPNRTIYTVGETAIDDEPPWCTENCQETVTRVVIDGSFADYRPKHCSYWFYAFVNVLAIDGLEYLNVSQATSLYWMFTRCSKLTALDLSGFDTRNVTNMRNMFTACESLMTIYASESFVVDKVNDSQYMFNLCASLVGGNGTTYDENYIDCTYARIDKSGTPGYFTKKTGDLTVAKIDKPTAVSGLTYTGTQQCGVTYDSRLAVLGDVCATDADEYTATFALPANTATETYAWADDTTDPVAVNWSISPRNVADAGVTFADIPDQTYTGSEITPPVSMSYAGAARSPGVDYVLTYRDNVEVGTASVDVSGQGNFTGGRTLTFKIVSSAADEVSAALDNRDLTFELSGDKDWRVATDDSYLGDSCMKSDGLAYRERSVMTTTVEGPGTLTFWCKYKTAGNNDYLTVRVDEDYNHQHSYSGTWDWDEFAVEIEGEGTHTVIWQHYNGNSSTESGYVLVDGVSWAPASSVLDFEYSVLGGKAVITKYVGKGGNVNIPQSIDGYSVMEIGHGAFNECGSLVSVVVPSSVTNIGGYAFAWCSGLQAVDIPSSVTVIGDNAFAGCENLTSVSIPPNVSSIEACAFVQCRSLPSVEIPLGVTNIGPYAFAECASLTKMTIPAQVESVGEGAFKSCSSLTEIAVENGNVHYVSAQGVLYTKDMRTLLCCPGGASETFEIPSSVQTVASCAFAGCCELTSILMSSNVTKIGIGAFSDCSGLSTIDISDGVTSVETEAFARCSGLTSVRIPSTVTDIDYYAFGWCSRLESVAIPSSVKSIQFGAFEECYALDTVYVDDGDETRVRELLTESGLDCSGIAFVSQQVASEPIPVDYVSVTSDDPWGNGYVLAGGCALYTMTYENPSNGGAVRTLMVSNRLDSALDPDGFGPSDIRIDGTAYDFGAALDAGFFQLQSGVKVRVSYSQEGTVAVWKFAAEDNGVLLPSGETMEIDCLANVKSNVTPGTEIYADVYFGVNDGVVVYPDMTYVNVVAGQAAAPGNVSATARLCEWEDEYEVDLSWDNALAEDTTYEIFRSEGEPFDLTQPYDYAEGESYTDVDAFYGGRTYYYAVAAHPEGDYVVGELGYCNVTIPILLNPAETTCELDADGSLGDWSVPVAANRLWTATTDDGWIHVTTEFSSDESAIDDCLTFTVDENDKGAREGKVVLTAGSVTKTISIEQTARTFDVFFEAGDHGVITSGEMCQTVAYGEAAVAPTVTADAGWRFVGWDKAFDCVTSELTVYALYEQEIVETKVATPVITPADGATFSGESCEVTITCATEGATIYYSTNGSSPRLKDQFKYTQPFTITDTTTVKAIAVKDGSTQSEIATAVITKINVETGKWNYDYASAKAFAEENDLPLVVFWTNPGCSHCATMIKAFETQKFLDWQADREYVFVYSEGDMAVRDLVKNDSGLYPYVAVQWPSQDIDVRFTARDGLMSVTEGDLVDQFTQSVDLSLFGVVLSVESDYGSPVPSVGDHMYMAGSIVTAAVETVVVEPDGRTQHVCVSGEGTGSAPATISSGGVVFEITADSTLVWNWYTQNMLTILEPENGTIGGAESGWVLDDASKTLTAVPDSGYKFDGWTGDTDGCAINGSTITVPMSKPRQIGAMFVQDVQVQVATPVITPADGSTFDTDSCTVEITCATPGATIYYSTNGSSPRLKDQFKYTQPFTVTETTTIKAVAVKDGFEQSEIATATIDKVDPPPLTLASALDKPKLSAVETDGDAEWEPVKDVTAVGGSSARSGEIGMLQRTCLKATVYGKGTLSFNWKVSCEDDYSGLYTYDHLTFSTVEGGQTNDIAKIDGETEWLPESVTFTTDGPHIILWIYSTDDYEESGFEDCGWVDNVVWTGDAPPSDIVISDIVTLPKAEVEAFMAKYPSLAAQVGGDAEAFAKLPSATGKLDANGNQMYVWQDIIAGTDPTNPDDKFKIVDIKFEDGELKVSWSPDLNENGTKNIRAYTEFGRKELGGSEKWTEMKDVDPAEKNDYKFRKVTVDMP